MNALEISGYTFIEKESGVYYPTSDCSHVNMLEFGADAEHGLWAFTLRNDDGTYEVVAFSWAHDDKACGILHSLFDSVKKTKDNAYYYYAQNYANYLGGLLTC